MPKPSGRYLDGQRRRRQESIAELSALDESPPARGFTQVDDIISMVLLMGASDNVFSWSSEVNRWARLAGFVQIALPLPARRSPNRSNLRYQRRPG
jgi:hypothetical protein